MGKPITPSVNDLLKLSNDELREALVELNSMSLRHLCRNCIKTIHDYKEHVKYEDKEKQELHGILNNISDIIERGRQGES
ncbi:hypothetical protein [Aureibacillus halotolerans]|uniref:Uncharacterized protein n=1 Tax=Aureibacillus halotolerans TaxID=1508390 RepID=A0A4R6TQN7_9BACI|nr:hypothetical protein [Aureibacillus halotolerans]TDQ35259.1 hypothetical protein EV213_12246 [Aureibacillus halotolerans]